MRLNPNLNFQSVSLSPHLLKHLQKKNFSMVCIVPGKNSCCSFRCAKAEVKVNKGLLIRSDGSIGETSSLEETYSPAKNPTLEKAPLVLEKDNIKIFIHPSLKSEEEELALGMDQFLFAKAFWAEGFTLKRRCPKTGR